MTPQTPKELKEKIKNNTDLNRYPFDEFWFDAGFLAGHDLGFAEGKSVQRTKDLPEIQEVRKAEQDRILKIIDNFFNSRFGNYTIAESSKQELLAQISEVNSPHDSAEQRLYKSDASASQDNTMKSDMGDMPDSADRMPESGSSGVDSIPSGSPTQNQNICTCGHEKSWHELFENICLMNATISEEGVFLHRACSCPHFTPQNKTEMK